MSQTGTAAAVSAETERRRTAFVAAARTAFFASGYAGTTMSSIASAVGGSKTTLWSYFPSKQELFAAVVDDIVEQYGTALSVDLPEKDDIRVALALFGKALLETLLSEPILALQRLVYSEAARFPDLAATFYERGPKQGKARLSRIIAQGMESGHLRQGDAALAARHFSALCQSGCYQKAMLNLPHACDEESVDDEIVSAVDCFYRAWAPPSSQESK